jgi:hypothetical protein
MRSAYFNLRAYVARDFRRQAAYSKRRWLCRVGMRSAMQELTKATAEAHLRQRRSGCDTHESLSCRPRSFDIARAKAPSAASRWDGVATNLTGSVCLGLRSADDNAF